MSSKAYTFQINPVGSGPDEADDSGLSLIHQVSPTWVLTFVRWANRDPLRISTPSARAIRDPLVVENDCIQVSTVMNKGTFTPSMSATLVMTDTNYETSVAPGDFVFVNMLNWPSDARRVANAARARTAINGLNDGFKGIFKVQSVRRALTVDPSTGTRIVLFKITGFGFTEFSTSIYFNPYLIDPNQDQQNQLLFASFIGQDWQKLVNKKGLVNVQDLIAVLIQSFIGTGISDTGRLVRGIVRSPNVHFSMPSLIGNLLGIPGVQAAKDIYNFIFGIQQYAAGLASGIQPSTVDPNGLNPSGLTTPFGRFYYTDTPCPGNTLLRSEYWNQIKAWEILNQYTNAPLNELFTCFRVSPDGDVMPTVIFRQIPFTNEDYSGTNPVTKFLTLPRWVVNPALVLEQEIGREEAARVNFVQFYGRSTLGVNGADIAVETAAGNYVYNIDDVQISGLRPYVVTTQFDDPTANQKELQSPKWAKIMGDALIDGHMKMNGTFVCAGLVDPITVGDNFQFDDIVYHIEQVQHVCTINPTNGVKTFRTTISVSNGVSVYSNQNGEAYPEMQYTNAYNLRQADSENLSILPGVSESQDATSRTPKVDGSGGVNSPFPTPSGTAPPANRNGDF